MKRIYIRILTLLLLSGIYTGLAGTAYAADFTDSAVSASHTGRL